jgi:hypothetical protein
MNSFRRITVTVLSSLLAALPAMPQPQTGNQPAGQINAMSSRPAAIARCRLAIRREAFAALTPSPRFGDRITSLW